MVLAVDPSVPGVEPYKLLTGAVVPRPIAFVSTVGPEGIPNAAPFSFYNAVSGNPPIVMVSVGRRSGEPKDTARNIDFTKDFVVNVVDEELAEKMNLAATEYPRHISEFDAVGLTPVPSVRVQAPRIAEAPIAMECTLVEKLELEFAPNDVYFGRVVMFHIRQDLCVDGTIDLEALRPVGRLAGNSYCCTRDLFELVRQPYVPEEQEGDSR